MKRLIVPILISIFGLCWLLAEMKIFDVGKMMWTLGLFSSGIILLTYLGFSKTTFVVGSMLVIGSGLSLLRYNGYITMEHELPVLVILLGLLMAINTTRIIPNDKNVV